MKPPPMAPPPRTIDAAQRPAVENIKAIQIPIGPPPRMAVPAGGGGPSGRPPPPRAPPPVDTSTMASGANEASPLDSLTLSQIGGPPTMAPAKVSGGKAAPSLKRGGITMFEEPPPSATPEVDIVADKKALRDDFVVDEVQPVQPAGGELVPSMIIKPPRPLPPGMPYPGIPTGQPLPPTEDPNLKIKRPAAPVRQIPESGRVPPKEDPSVVKKKEKAPDPAPPITPAPYIKGKRAQVIEEVILPRRERENAEFESSSDEDEADFPSIRKPDNTGASVRKLASQGTKGPKQVPLEQALLENDKKLGGIELSQEEPPPVTQAANIPEPQIAGAAAKKSEGAKPGLAETQPPGSADLSVAETLDSVSLAKSLPVLALPATKEAPVNIVSSYVPPPPVEFEVNIEPSQLAKEVKPGRFSVRCIEGIDIKRKSDPNKIPRTDPYLKVKLGVAEKWPWKQSQTIRKQDNFPKFNNEIISFDVMDPVAYIFGGDIQMLIELWNKGSFKDELLGTVTMSCVRFFKTPYLVFNEKLPLYGPGEKVASMKVWSTTLQNNYKIISLLVHR
jgi:hypothetical protein